MSTQAPENTARIGKLRLGRSRAAAERRQLHLRLKQLAGSPLTVLAAVVAGAMLGLNYPEVAKALAPISKVYIDLLKMIVLPFIVSSIIFSLRSLINDPKAAGYVARVFAWVLIISVAAVVVGGSLALIMQPGVVTDQKTAAALGHLINSGTVTTDLDITLHDGALTATSGGLADALAGFIPSNVFHALTNGDTIKVLVFSLLFGFAVGFVPYGVSGSLSDALDTIYRTCLILTNWFNLFLPIATFAMIAEQAATIGLESAWLMVDFLTTISLASLILAVIGFFIIAWRAKTSVLKVLKAHQNVLVMAVATRSSIACIPAMIDTLVDRLKFRRVVAELLVPLQAALAKGSSVLMFVVGTIFIAQLYGKPLSAADLFLIASLSTLLGPTTAGMSGFLIVAQTGIVCGYLGLPFDAAFVLFIAVETLNDTIRTVLQVVVITTASAAIAPLEEQKPAEVEAPEVQPVAGAVAA